MTLTLSHLAKAAHAIGINAHASTTFPAQHSRNYFLTTPDSPEWCDLVAAGLATSEAAPDWCVSDAVFRLTQAGVDLVERYALTAPKDRAAFLEEVSS